MIVHIPTALQSYTGGAAVEIAPRGPSLGHVLLALDQHYPGLRFRMVDEQDRIRRHIRIFAGSGQIYSLDQPMPAQEPIHIIQALSGG